jgi:hypothetical protein
LSKNGNYENVLERLYYDTSYDKLTKFDYKKIYFPNIDLSREYKNIKDVEIILKYKSIISFEMETKKKKLTEGINEEIVKKNTIEEKNFKINNKNINDRELDEFSLEKENDIDEIVDIEDLSEKDEKVEIEDDIID